MIGSDIVVDAARFYDSLPTSRVGVYDAARPDPLERNRALRLDELLELTREPDPRPGYWLYRKHQLLGDQLRTLVCHGPALLRWVGTVEVHVAALIAKAEVDSRSELIAALWSSPRGLSQRTILSANLRDEAPLFQRLRAPQTGKARG